MSRNGAMPERLRLLRPVPSSAAPPPRKYIPEAPKPLEKKTTEDEIINALITAGLLGL